MASLARRTVGSVQLGITRSDGDSDADRASGGASGTSVSLGV